MANIHGIEVSGQTYDLKDTTARNGVQTNANDIDGIEGKIPASASSSNKLATKEDIPEVTDTLSTTESKAISSRAVTTRLNDYNTATDMITNDILSAIQSVVNATENYRNFSGSTGANFEGAFFGFRRGNSDNWCCLFITGPGSFIRVQKINGVVTQTILLE